MTTPQDSGIVKGYIDQFMQLGMKANSGDDVDAEVRELVTKVLGHMDVWIYGDKLENKRTLIGQLKFRAELIASSHPAQAKILMDAHNLAASLIAPA